MQRPIHQRGSVWFAGADAPVSSRVPSSPRRARRVLTASVRHGVPAQSTLAGHRAARRERDHGPASAAGRRRDLRPVAPSPRRRRGGGQTRGIAPSACACGRRARLARTYSALAWPACHTNSRPATGPGRRRTWARGEWSFGDCRCVAHGRCDSCLPLRRTGWQCRSVLVVDRTDSSSTDLRRKQRRRWAGSHGRPGQGCDRRHPGSPRRRYAALVASASTGSVQWLRNVQAPAALRRACRSRLGALLPTFRPRHTRPPCSIAANLGVRSRNPEQKRGALLRAAEDVPSALGPTWRHSKALDRPYRPASNPLLASRTVTPHMDSSSSIAQPIEEGLRSPIGRRAQRRASSRHGQPAAGIPSLERRQDRDRVNAGAPQSAAHTRVSDEPTAPVSRTSDDGRGQSHSTNRSTTTRRDNRSLYRSASIEVPPAGFEPPTARLRRPGRRLVRGLCVQRGQHICPPQ